MTTAKLALELPDGTDVITRTTQLNANWQKIDDGIGYTLCTSSTRPSTPYAGQPIYETDTRRRLAFIGSGWRLLAGDTFDSVGAGMARAVRPVRQFGLDGTHSAFPDVCVLLDGTAVLVYRQGTDHSASRDGVIKLSKSTDSGRTWAAPVTILTGSPAGTDLRDPCVSLSRDGTKVYLTYFKGTAVLSAAGVFFRYSEDGGDTWSAEVRVDNTLPYAASSAPVVELDNGTLVAPYYGKSGVETFDSVWVAKSVNGGTSWTSTRIVNGQTASLNYQEPWITLKGQTAVMAFRWGGASQIGVSTSVDNTVNWTAGAAKFTGTGRPTVFWLNDQTVTCVYRRLSNGDAVVRSSKDTGANWLPERLVDSAQTAAGWMTYAGADKVSSGVWLCPLAQETSTSASRIYLTAVGEAGANTPYGTVPTDADAAAANLDTVLFGTNFEQADGSLPPPWTLAAGAVTVANGELASATADNVPDFPRVFVSTNDMEVEADIWNGSGGFESGSAVVFRMINATAYLMFTVETAGVNFRLYKVVGGVPTQLTTTAGQMPFNTYNTYKAIARGQEIRCFFNGAAVLYHLMSGGDFTTFQPGNYAGIKLNSQGTTTHKARRFLVRG